MALTSAQQTIVVNNLPFANRIASQLSKSNPDISSDDIRGAAYEGLDGHKPLNIRSIARKLSLSEDTVSRQLQKTLNTLKITL